MTWADVKAIIVKEVTAPVTDNSWEMFDAALVLMECDNGERSFFHTFAFDSCGSKQKGNKSLTLVKWKKGKPTRDMDDCSAEIR